MTLAEQLDQMTFGEMWAYPIHDATVDRIWAGGSRRDGLDAVLSSEASSQKARFIVCEVYFAKDIFFMRRHPPHLVAGIYADALAGDFTGRANSWGLLYQHEDEGPVGIAFLTIGQAAIPALVPLLSDERTHLVYEGSEEATVGNAYRFRVKDFAAHYIGRIRGQPLTYHASLEARDAQIDALEKTLEATTH